MSRGAATPSDVGRPWTIDELARVSGVPSRTIREYRTFGVLPPPSKQGRVAIYDEEHLRRLSLIGRLQDRGYSLAGIRDLLGAWEQGAGLATVLDLDEPEPAVLDEAPLEVTRSQLAELVPGIMGARALRAAREAGLVQLEPRDHFIVRSPALLQSVSEAATAGVPLLEAIAFAAQARDAMAIVANAAVDLLVTHVWDTAVGREGTAESTAMVRRSRLLLAQAVASLLADELGRALGEASAHTAGLDQLLADLRVGVIRTATKAPEANGGKP